MLLTSPGDSGSSLPIDSLPPPASTLEAQSGIEGDRVTTTTAIGTLVDGDRAQPKHKDEDGLYALRQAGGLKAPRRSRIGLWSAETLAKLAESDTISSDAVSFAAPLSPLRERDLTALSDLFLREDIYAIETDVKQRLLLLLPEPCWEEEVFNFLEEFL